MSIDRSSLAAGMNVVSSDGDQTGQVKEIRSNDFLVDRPVAPDIYLPYSAVHQVTGETVELGVTAAQLDDLSWADTGDKNTGSIKVPLSPPSSKLA